DRRPGRHDAGERDAPPQRAVRHRVGMRSRWQRRGDRAGAPELSPSVGGVGVSVVEIAATRVVGARYEPAGADGIARIVIDRPTDTVNAIDPPLIADLLRAVTEARQARPRGLVVARAKPDQFVGGA